MGKTQPTYRDLVREERGNWEITRKWLRKHLQDDYDSLWMHAEQYSDAVGQANPRDPMKGVLFSICLGQQIEIRRLEERLGELEEQ